MQNIKHFNRRHFLVTGASIGLGLIMPGVARAGNVQSLSGAVFINKQRAQQDSLVRPGDLVTTSHNGRIEFTVGGDAFLVKERSSLHVGEPGFDLVNTLRLLTGKLLSVFETGRERSIVTANATIGIRGTACFLNVKPRSLYYCNCYGKTHLTATGISESFEAIHHNAHEIDFEGEQYMGMRVMQVLDHDDDELRRLESYVGRVPAFDRQ